MMPRLRHPLRVRLWALLRGIDLAQYAPYNTKGGVLRAAVGRLAHSPVYGMERIQGQWWAHTARGWWPLHWYIEQAQREQIPMDPVVLARLEATK